MVYKEATDTAPGNAAIYGAPDIKKYSQLLNAGPFPYDYIIYTDAADSNKVKAINGSTSEIEFPNANAAARLTFKSVFDALTATGLKGGRVLIKNGTYLIDNISTSLGLEIGNTTDGASQFLTVEGESREGVIIQSTYAPTIAYHTWLCRTNALFTNITFDGNSLGTDGMMSLLSSFGTATVMQVDNCKFKRARGIHLYYGSIQLGPIVKNSLFENPSGVQDQMAFQSINSANIEGCLFDRTTGTSVGSMLTSGVGNNIHINNNTFRGATTTSALWAISIEAFGDYNRVEIEGNICENRCINIGATGTWAYLYKAISVKNNILNKGYIRIVGPDSSFTNSIKYVDIDGNILIDSLFFGIGCYRIGDSVLIQNNLIKDSNNTLTTPTNGWGLIYVQDCTYTRIKDNMLRMSDSTANASPFGIGFALCTDITIKNNEFVNTTSNPNYNDFASSTTVVLNAGASPSDYNIYIDTNDSNKVKALNGKTHEIDYSHASDFGTVFNACVTAAAGNRVKISLQPSALFSTSTTCTIKSYVMIDGNYAEIKLANGSNVDIFKGENFATLTGTNAFSTDVPHDFTIRYLRVDGNKANNVTAGYGIRVVAWGYDLDHVFVHNCKNDGIYSEWGTQAGCPLTADLTKRCMEAYWDNVYVHDCGGRGITYRGPHDSVLSNTFSWGNDSFCVSFETVADTYSGGCTCSNYHAWGGTNNAIAYTNIDNTSVLMTNFISEGADGVGGIGIHVKAGSKLWGDCEVFANETGIKFDVTANYSDLRIDSFGNTHGVELLGNQNKISGYLHDNTTTDIKIGSGGVAVSYSMFNLKMTRTPLAISWLNTSNSDNFGVIQIETSAGHVALTGTPDLTTNDLLISSKGAGTNYTTATPVNVGAVQTLTNKTFSGPTITDGTNIAFSTTTGTKIGTATTQKLAFYNATPIVQPAANADTSAAVLADLEIEVNQLKQLLRNLGLMAP